MRIDDYETYVNMSPAQRAEYRRTAEARELALRAERDAAPKDEDGYPVERGIPLPVHLSLLPRR